MGGPTSVDSIEMCVRLHNCITDFASDLPNAAISCFKTVFSIILVNTIVFLTLSIIPDDLRYNG